MAPAVKGAKNAAVTTVDQSSQLSPPRLMKYLVYSRSAIAI